jgi:hypothetical protein
MINFRLHPSTLIRCYSTLLKNVLKKNLHCSNENVIPDNHRLLATKIWHYLILGHEITKVHLQFLNVLLVHGVNILQGEKQIYTVGAGLKDCQVG